MVLDGGVTFIALMQKKIWKSEGRSPMSVNVIDVQNLKALLITGLKY